MRGRVDRHATMPCPYYAMPSSEKHPFQSHLTSSLLASGSLSYIHYTPLSDPRVPS